MNIHLHDLEQGARWLVQHAGEYMYLLTEGDVMTLRWTYGILAGILGLAWLWFEWLSPRAQRGDNGVVKWVALLIIVGLGVWVFSLELPEDKKEAEPGAEASAPAETSPSQPPAP